MSSLAKISLPDFGGLDSEYPVISTSEYLDRIAALRARMAEGGLDCLLVYGDREHFANLAYLTGFDPRFEEALLLLNRKGEKLLLVGNECMGYLPDAALDIAVEKFQDFSLPGQPRDASRPLRKILSEFGIGRGARIGCVGWKYYRPDLVDGGAEAMDLPAYIVDLVRDLTGDRRQVSNVTAWLINPHDGLRTINSADQLAQMEFGALHSSKGVHAAVLSIRPGVRECELPMHALASGLPLSCHPMASFGDKVRRGLSSPSRRQAKLGDPFALALGVWGSLTCRAGMVAEKESDLTPDLAGFFPKLAANYFDIVAAWYERIKIGATGGEVFDTAQAARDTSLFDFAVNPGHLIHLDEWMDSPFQQGNRDPLRSGMAIQMDIIPVSKGPFCYANAEDGIALADEALRAEIAARYPACWQRITARRKFVTEALGISLDPSVLPFSNIPAWFCPYALNPELIFVK